jgi:hypothetical protein
MAWVAVGVIGSTVVGGLMSADSNNAAENANQASADATALNAQISREQWDRYKQMYSPLEQQYVNEAQNYDSPENYSRAAGEASATVSNQFSKAKDRLQRTPGLDPSSGAYQSSMVGLDLAQAANDATAQNAARQGVRDTAYNRKTNAINLGKGLPGTAQQGLSNAASQSAQLGQVYQNRANQEAQQWGGAAGALIGAMPGAVKTVGAWGQPAGGSASGGNFMSQESFGFNGGSGWGL